MSRSAYRRPRRVGAAILIVLVATATLLPTAALATDPPGAPQPAPTPAPTTGATQPDGATAAAPAYAERVEAVIAAARAYLGTPYRVGTEGPYTIDCSGLVFRAFANAGELGQVGSARLRAAGYMRWFAAHELLTTDSALAERGDLVMYANGEHIGIYLGDGRVISAVVTGVTVHSLNGISVPVTGFLGVDWTGKRGPFPNVVLPAPMDEAETPVALVPAAPWAPEPLADAVAQGPIQGTERVDMRTANSRTYQDDDGRFTTETFSRPIHYLPVDSTEWQPIDLRFHESDTDASVADAAPVAVSVRDVDAEGPLVGLNAGELSIGLTPVRVGEAAGAPVVGEDGLYIDYRDLFGPGMSLRVYPRADGFKSFIVLARKPDIRSMNFVLDAGDLSAVAELDGSVTLRDADGVSFARLPRPMLLDSSDEEGGGGGVRPGMVTLVPSVTEAGETLLALTVDRAGLEEQVYPAYVDLGIVDFPDTAAAATHTFAASAHPASNFSTYQRPESPGYAELWHGRRPGRDDDNEAYLRFPGVAELLRGSTVESASLAALPYWQGSSSEASGSWLGRVTGEWDVRSLTWDTRPAATVDALTYDTTQGNWSDIDVTSYVADVVSGTATDYGLVLHADDAGRGHWKRLVAESLAGAGALEPRLIVHWSGLRPTAAATTEAIASNVSLAWSNATLAPSPTRVQIQVSTDGFESILLKVRAKDKALAAQAIDLATDGFQPGAYAWRLRAQYAEDGGWSEWSNSGTFVVLDPVQAQFAQPDLGMPPAPPAPPAPTATPAPLVITKPVREDRTLVF